MEKDNTARSCLTKREWHVAIRVGVLPWASEISNHLGALWKRTGRGLMNVARKLFHERGFDIVNKMSKESSQKGDREERKGRGCVGDEGRGLTWAWKRSLNPWQSTSHCVWEARKPSPLLALLWRLQNTHPPLTSPCVPTTLTQRKNHRISCRITES